MRRGVNPLFLKHSNQVLHLVLVDGLQVIVAQFPPPEEILSAHPQKGVVNLSSEVAQLTVVVRWYLKLTTRVHVATLGWQLWLLSEGHTALLVHVIEISLASEGHVGISEVEIDLF